MPESLAREIDPFNGLNAYMGDFPAFSA